MGNWVLVLFLISMVVGTLAANHGVTPTPTPAASPSATPTPTLTVNPIATPTLTLAANPGISPILTTPTSSMHLVTAAIATPTPTPTLAVNPDASPKSAKYPTTPTPIGSTLRRLMIRKFHLL